MSDILVQGNKVIIIESWVCSIDVILIIDCFTVLNLNNATGDCAWALVVHVAPSDTDTAEVVGESGLHIIWHDWSNTSHNLDVLRLLTRTNVVSCSTVGSVLDTSLKTGQSKTP
jgi:hypothetical protein